MDIQDRLTKYMDELEKALSTSAEFAAKEAPLVVQEFLAWEFWSSVMGLVMGLCVIAAVVIAAYRFRNIIANESNYQKNVAGPLIMLPIVIGVAAVLACGTEACVDAHRAVKVSVAPRLVLLEKVSSLAHGNNK